jgi:hypothetical protein
MSALFEVEESLPPRTQWLRRHDLVVRDYQDRRNGGVEIHSLNGDGLRFVCANRAQTQWASGTTMEEAERAYCERYGLEWWKLAEWNGAMETRVECMEV